MAKGRKTGGRRKGTPNRLTVCIKTAIEGAFAKVGGEEFLVKVAREDPRTFCALLGRVLPAQLEHSGTDGGPLEIRPDNMTVLDVARRIAYALHRGMQAKKDAEIGRNGVSLGGAVRGDPASGV